MEPQPACPQCQSEYTYAEGNLWICPNCAHEWSTFTATAKTEPGQLTTDSSIRDANGNILNDGDTVTVIKELKIKGSSLAVKVGTKVKNIRLRESDDGHDISCKIDGIGALNLKSEFVKKA